MQNELRCNQPVQSKRLLSTEGKTGSQLTVQTGDFQKVLPSSSIRVLNGRGKISPKTTKMVGL